MSDILACRALPDAHIVVRGATAHVRRGLPLDLCGKVTR
jgi:hypothetical protein